MKTRLVVLLALAAAVAAVPAFAGSAADANGGKISVTGSASVQSTPEVSQWSFGVTAQADSATKALAGASTALRRVVDAVRAAGVAQADVRTEYVSVSPQTDDRGRVVDRFVASSSVSVTVRKLASAGRVVDAAVDAGANTVGGPSFAPTDADKLYRQALREAVAQARLSAQALAEASNLTLGRVVEIQEGGAQPLPLAAEAGKASDAGVVVEPGQTATTATVTVTWSTT